MLDQGRTAARSGPQREEVLSRSPGVTIITRPVTDVNEPAPATAEPVSPHATTFIRRSRATGEEQTFHLIGTAHISKKSVEEVTLAIESLRPDTVCVELCATRYAALTDPSRFRALDVPAIVREGRAGFTLATLALQAFQTRMGARLGVRPGAELLAAVAAAERVGAAVVLADRDVQTTLKRTWGNLGIVKRVVLLIGLFASAFGGDELDEEQVEALKRREHISDMMTELGRKFPEVKVPLIDERDQYLVSHIVEAPGNTVVAVVGAGHVDGMLKILGNSVDRSALEVVPMPSFAARLRPWAPVLLAAVAVRFALARGVPPGALFVAWVGPTAVGASLLLLAARARIETWLVSAVASPLLAFVPGSASRVLGGLEAALRVPSPEDGARVGREVTSMRSALSNPVTRTLLVTVAAEYGVGLGRLIAVAWLLVRAWRG